MIHPMKNFKKNIRRIKNGNGQGVYICTNCGAFVDSSEEYCHNCKIKLQEKKK